MISTVLKALVPVGKDPVGATGSTVPWFVHRDDKPAFFTAHL